MGHYSTYLALGILTQRIELICFYPTHWVIYTEQKYKTQHVTTSNSHKEISELKYIH